VSGLISNAGTEVAVWIPLALGAGYVLSAGPRPFLSGFICGLLMALWQHLLNVALWDTYVAQNPEMAEQIVTAAVENSIAPQAFVLMSMPIVGVFFGLFVGLVAWGLSKTVRKAKR
jgi:hypothetical protein